MTIDEILEPRSTQVASFAWGKLHANEATAPVSSMLPTMRAILAKWLYIFPGLDSGNKILLFTDNENILFNSALGCYVASLYRPTQQIAQAQTALVGLKLGPDEYTFAQPIPVDFINSLLDEAYGYLYAIGIIDTTAIYNHSIIGRGGHRRNARRLAGLSETANPLYSLYADDRSTWEWELLQAIK
jgi:hypothetical protein